MNVIKLKAGLFFLFCFLVSGSLLAKTERKTEHTESPESPWFPDWGTPRFSWGLGPIVGFKMQQQSNEYTRESTAQSEFGVTGYISGVPLLSGNPGLYLRPHAGLVWGSINGEAEVKATGAKHDIERKYQRGWAGSDLLINAHWYRHVLGITVGRKDFDDDIGDLQSFAIGNDFGVLILTWFSAHYTHRYLQARAIEYTEPFLREHDHWLNARMFFDFRDFMLRIGPGFATADQIFLQGTDDETKIKSRSDYVKTDFSLHLFWKLGASAAAKYTYAADDDEDTGEFARTLLPDESLYDIPSVIMPEDSLLSTVFIGAHNLFLGLGLGYRYSEQILNFSEKGDKKRQTTNDQGIVITYEMAF